MNEVIWHDVECGGYEADLPLWEELAAESEGDIMEMGCGTGRVVMHIRGKTSGRYVLGIDWNPELVEALWERSQMRRGDGEIADVRDFDFHFGGFGLVLAPMQLIQLLDADDRIECLSCAAGRLAPGGMAAFAIVEELPPAPEDSVPPLPDVHQVDGWVYSSLPLEPIVEPDRIVLRRLRQTVDPDGNMSEELNQVDLCVLSAETLEREALEAGLRPLGRREIPATEAHVGSTVVLLEKGS
jgi:SAM-dependent methyltransferase